MTWRAGRRWPRGILAAPVSQPPSMRHSATRSGPAARWIAPSTPPPPSSEELAALTMASRSRPVMSATTISIVAAPHVAVAMEVIAVAAMSRPLRLGLRAQVERAAPADVVEMLVEEAPRGAAAAGVEHAKEIVVGRELGVG